MGVAKPKSIKVQAPPVQAPKLEDKAIQDKGIKRRGRFRNDIFGGRLGISTKDDGKLGG
jgi:hypothetical protein